MVDKEREVAEKATQSYAALGIGLVCIVIGLPLWWKTTEVYRVALPYAEIAELSQGQVSYSVDFSVVVFDESASVNDLIGLSDKLKKRLQYIENDPRLIVSYRGNVRAGRVDETTVYDESKSLQDLDEKVDSLREKKEAGKYYIYLLPSNSHLNPVAGFVGKRRAAYLTADNGLSKAYGQIVHILQDIIVNEAANLNMFLLAKGAQHQQKTSMKESLKADKDGMRAVRSHPGYELTFTLLNPQPDIIAADWDIVTAVKKFLSPLQKTLEEYAEITAKSQYLHYASIGVKPERSSEDYFILSPDDLPHIINPIEAFLGSHVSTNPNLNFIVYIPTRDQSPLRILSGDASASASSAAAAVPSENNAFLSPRWGGMQVYNVAVPDNSSLPYPVQLDMRAVMETCVSQLRLLLGITSSQVSKDGLVVEQPGNKAITEWELDSWLRKRCIENVASATATLRSLAQLLEEIGNIVINDDIGTEVEKAVSAIKKSQSQLSRGKLRDAFLMSRQAIQASEKAFFDPSLLELLYFPEDQKFAIYIPLFLPISIPVVLSTIQAFKWMTGRDKQKTE